MDTQENLARAERERKAYDEDGMWESSDKWHSRFPHVFFSPNSVRYDNLFHDLIAKHSSGKTALEIGCADGLTSKKVSNLGARYILGTDVSEEFINKAKQLEIPGKIEFRLADALQPIQGSFDVIFGRSILHHIDFQEALVRLYRENLNKGGIMVFMEPLGSNPLTKLYHVIADSAHTPDEKPFGRAELTWFRKSFSNVRIYPFNLASFVSGLFSHLLFSKPDNVLLRVSDRVDEWLAAHLSFLRPYFRHCLIVIER